MAAVEPIKTENESFYHQIFQLPTQQSENKISPPSMKKISMVTSGQIGKQILQNFYVTSARRRKRNLRGTTNDEDPVVWSTIDKNSLKGVDELEFKFSSCLVREIAFFITKMF